MSAFAIASQQPVAAPRPRLIDPRGQRFGAAFSAVILAAAFAIQAPLLVAVIGVALGVSALLGTQYFILGRPWPLVRRVLRLGPPAEPEAEFPPRFAQALGSVGLLFAAVLFAVGAGGLAWLPVVAVAGLQTVLAATGYCLGCRLYFLRWYVPSLFDRLVAAVPRLAR
ncbi:MAG TPA: DUF4395 domain-containing protein [Candidatus Eisenbacteria bacterium]|nr:DUF4395 domain-containing protein [Candidatus Eisenbacteria bacterium]